jgi:mannose-6-phosphate isomerase-like protein (cupin superfamily)
MSEELLVNPVTGETMRVLESTADVFKIEYALRAHGEIPLEHFHPNVAQEISVSAGEMHVTINGEHKVIKAGETYAALPSAVHFQWNPSRRIGRRDAITIFSRLYLGLRLTVIRMSMGCRRYWFVPPFLQNSKIRSDRLRVISVG